MGLRLAALQPKGRQAAPVRGEPLPNALVQVLPKATARRYTREPHPLRGEFGRLLQTELDVATGEMLGRVRLTDGSVAVVPLRCMRTVKPRRAPDPLPPALAPVGFKPSYLAPICCPPPHVLR